MTMGVIDSFFLLPSRAVLFRLKTEKELNFNMHSSFMDLFVSATAAHTGVMNCIERNSTMNAALE